LTGTNLTGCSAVSFGGTAATGIVVDSATQVHCTSPAKTAGTISVTATTANGTSNGVNYTYSAGGTSYTTTLMVAEDSFVSSASAGTNYNGGSIVQQKNAAANLQGYWKFNLASVQGTTITKAYFRPHYWTTGACALKVYSCATDTWAEGTLTWNNKPAAGTSQASFTSPNNNWILIDVTSYVNANFNGDKLITFIVMDDSTPGYNINVQANGSQDATNKAQLVVISQ